MGHGCAPRGELERHVAQTKSKAEQGSSKRAVVIPAAAAPTLTTDVARPTCILGPPASETVWLQGAGAGRAVLILRADL
jgi:hypothetical protein